MRNHKVIPKVALVSKPPRVIVGSYVSNRKLSNTIGYVGSVQFDQIADLRD